MRRRESRIGFLLGALLIAGCASNIPLEIRKPPPNNPSVAQVRANPEPFVGARVRWGGTIGSVENEANESQVQVIERALQSNGRPVDTDQTAGRFIAIIEGFLDPLVYTQGRELTVTGVIQGRTTRKIGGYDYTFPVVRVDNYLLWPPRIETPDYPPPSYFYDPWYPWGPYYYPYYPWRYHRRPI